MPTRAQAWELGGVTLSGIATADPFARKGIRGTGKHFGCNLFPAITNRGELAFRVYKGMFYASMFHDCLERLLKQAGRKVFPILPAVLRRTRVWLPHRLGSVATASSLLRSTPRPVETASSAR